MPLVASCIRTGGVIVRDVRDPFRRRLAEYLAAPMFLLSLLFLVVIAAVLVLWVDVPLFFSFLAREGADGGGEALPQSAVAWISPSTARTAGLFGFLTLVVLWPFFAAELLLQYLARNRTQPFWPQRQAALLACFCPPLRLCARHCDMDGKIWFPHLGWQVVDRTLQDRLEKLFSIPMIMIALLILPVLLVEVGMREQVLNRPWLQCLLNVSTGLIWFAFAAEFLVMVSVADKKLKYCKDHWLDMAIILLPFIAFLRSLRVIRATRLARLAKVQQLSRMGRLYRLRGLAMRALRALLILELINRLLPISPARRLKRLQLVLAEKEADIAALRQQIADLERHVKEQEQHSYG
jgi:voltage-gated potassium channel